MGEGAGDRDTPLFQQEPQVSGLVDAFPSGSAHDDHGVSGGAGESAALLGDPGKDGARGCGERDGSPVHGVLLRLSRGGVGSCVLLASRAGAQGGGVPLCQAVGEFLDPVGSVEARAPRGG